MAMGSNTNIYYEAELWNDVRRRKCPHCHELMVVSDKALNAYYRKLRVVRTRGKYCPYCHKELYPKPSVKK